MQPFMNMELEQWLEGRPEVIKSLARRYPPGTFIVIDGEPNWVIKYWETKDGGAVLGISNINPAIDYDQAIKSEEFICVSCLEGKCDTHEI
jgi:hypothetical protein